MKQKNNLTAVTSSYKLKAVLAILAILLFFLLFSALVASFAFLTYYSISYEMNLINQWTIIAKIAAIAGSGMLLVFSLKFLFKLRNHKPENRIKLNRDKHQELWHFVHEICLKSGAPKPKNIYVDPDVNAYVAYTNSWLSLFLPVKKELTIGMALVDCLDVSEFRAVVAHEFGHFSQRSMRIGSYIMSANTIIHDMIFTRDRWDQLLEQWRGTDFRLSFAAWIITPIIWLIRQLLNLFYLLLNLMHSSLSREMEFNADKVAVSVSGSDAILSALWKLDFGSERWNRTMNNAYLAAQKKVFTDNLYYHNGIATEKEAQKQAEMYALLELHPKGGKCFFKTDENSRTQMYASHPSNDKRQESAKSPFVEGEIDKRSPWKLFDKVNSLQEQMTTLIYEKYLDKKEVLEPSREAFQNFVDTEESTTGELEKAYENTFENRLFEVPDKHVLAVKHTEPSNLGTITSLKAEVREHMVPVKALDALIEKAQQIAQRSIKERSLVYDGKKYSRRNLEEGYEKMIGAQNKLLFESFKDWDRRFCLLHLHLCPSEEERDQLLNRYEQHGAIVDVFKMALSAKNRIYKDLQQVQSNPELTEIQVSDFGREVQFQMAQINKPIADLDKISFVPLPNIESLTELKNAIIEGGAFVDEPGNIFENGGFDRILQRLEQTIAHLNRIHSKSMYEILAFQNSFVQD